MCPNRPPGVPAVGRPEPLVVGQEEVIADRDVDATVAVEIAGQHRQCQRAGGEAGVEPQQSAGRARVAAVAVHEDAAGRAWSHGMQLGVVGGARQVQVSVGVEVGPVGGVERFPYPGVGPDELRPAGCARVQPEGGWRHRVGEEQVQPAVAVGVDQVHRPRCTHRQHLHVETQAALVPMDGVGAGKVGQHDVQVAVDVQVADAHAGAVAGVEADASAAGGGGVRQKVLDEAALAGPSVDTAGHRFGRRRGKGKGRKRRRGGRLRCRRRRY